METTPVDTLQSGVPLAEEPLVNLGKKTPAVTVTLKTERIRPRNDEMRDWARDAKRDLLTLNMAMLRTLLKDYRTGYFFDTLSPNMKRREPETLSIAVVGPRGSGKSAFLNSVFRAQHDQEKGTGPFPEGEIEHINHHPVLVNARKASLTPHIDLIEILGFDWSEGAFDQNLRNIKRWFMGLSKFVFVANGEPVPHHTGDQQFYHALQLDDEPTRIDLIVFCLPATALSHEVAILRAFIHQFKYLGIPIGVVITKMDTVDCSDFFPGQQSFGTGPQTVMERSVMGQPSASTRQDRYSSAATTTSRPSLDREYDTRRQDTASESGESREDLKRTSSIPKESDPISNDPEAKPSTNKVSEATSSNLETRTAIASQPTGRSQSTLSPILSATRLVQDAQPVESPPTNQGSIFSLQPHSQTSSNPRPKLPDINTLHIRPLVYGKGIQRVVNYRQSSPLDPQFSVSINENILRSFFHFLLTAEMGIGVDVTATSINLEIFRMRSEVLAMVPKIPPSVPILVGAGLDANRDAIKPEIKKVDESPPRHVSRERYFGLSSNDWYFGATLFSVGILSHTLTRIFIDYLW